MVWRWGERLFSGVGGSIAEGFAGVGRGGWIRGIGGGGGGDWWDASAAIGVTAMLGLAVAATIVLSSRRGSLKSPWSRRKQKHVLTPQQWKRFFTPEGKLFDGGAKLLKKVRSGGVDPSIRSEVWPFLLGVYELNSSEDERNAVRKQKRLNKVCMLKRSLWLKIIQMSFLGS